MKRKTGFFFDERCFWHSTGLHAVTLPVGGWVQPPAGGGHAESPETKRRMKNLMDVSGLTPQLALRSAAPASLEDLRRIHPDSYLERFKAISDNGGGMLGKEAPLGPGSYEIACLSAGLACAAVEAVLKGELDNAYSLSRRAAERLGFSWEGRLRQRLVRKGRTRDSDMLSIIDGEWPARDAALRAWLAAENFTADGQQIKRLEAFR